MVDHPQSAAERLICALDVPTREEALQIIDELGDTVSFYKVGLQLFISEGMNIVREIGGRGKKVFLDLKMDDVTETIKLAVTEIARHKVELLTIHGNGATAKAAIEGRNGNARPYLLSVTLLSSLNESDLKDILLIGSKHSRFGNLNEFVLWRASVALESGCEGLIASGSTIGMIREKLGEQDFLIVAPGIRPAGKSLDDHKRTATPAQAIKAGADYLVVGRPIRDDSSRQDSALRIIEEIDSALAVSV